jgi:uncharacterized protein
MQEQAVENSRCSLVFFDTMGWNIYHARLMFARPFIDSLDFAKNGMELSGEVGVEKLPRLADLLHSTEGLLSYSISGYQDKNSLSSLELVLQGSCKLRCQRCLGSLDYEIDVVNELVLVSETDFDPIEVDEGPDTIVASRHLDVLDLVEDELLLSLPFAPKHPVNECQFATESLEGPESRFSTLAKLKQVK